MFNKIQQIKYYHLEQKKSRNPSKYKSYKTFKEEARDGIRTIILSYKY